MKMRIGAVGMDISYKIDELVAKAKEKAALSGTMTAMPIWHLA